MSTGQGGLEEIVLVEQHFLTAREKGSNGPTDSERLTSISATSTTAWATYRLRRSCTDLCEEPIVG